MKVKLSYDLKTKILEAAESWDFNSWGMLRSGTVHNIKLIIKIKDNENLAKECIKWMKHIHAYFKSSYKPLKTDFGPLEGLWPIAITDKFVEFRADMYDPKRINWKDWFIIENIEDPPQFIQEVE